MLKQIAEGILGIGIGGEILFGIPFLPLIIAYIIDQEKEYAIFFYIFMILVFVGIIGLVILFII